MCSRILRTFVPVAILTVLAALNAQSATAPEPGDLRGVGNVTFSITCSPDVQSDFARGVALLHSFFYEEARRVFTSVADLARKLRKYIRAYARFAKPFRWTYSDQKRRIRTYEITGTAH